MQVPAVIRKDRHRVHFQNARPLNNHHGFPMETGKVVRFFTKNTPARNRGFSKKRDRTAADFQKSLIGLLRIFLKA